MGDPVSIPGLGSSRGEGNGNPPKYFSLENPMDGGAWWATVHGVTKSRTQLSDFTFTFTSWWGCVTSSLKWGMEKSLPFSHAGNHSQRQGNGCKPQITRKKIQEQTKLVTVIYKARIPSLRHGYTVQLKVMLSFSVIFKLFFYLWIHDIIQFDDTRHFFPLMTSFLRVGTGSWLST